MYHNATVDFCQLTTVIGVNLLGVLADIASRSSVELITTETDATAVCLSFEQRETDATAVCLSFEQRVTEYFSF